MASRCRKSSTRWREVVIASNSAYCPDCFCCGQNFNNIDLLIALGYDFLPAVELLEQWLRAYQGHRAGSKS